MEYGWICKREDSSYKRTSRHKKSIKCGVSGGVDSSVVAAMLNEALPSEQLMRIC